MKKKRTFAFLSSLAALCLLSSCGADGAQGEKGEKGDIGPTGQKGSDGDDGTSLLTGEGEPSGDTGKDGDSYIDTKTFDYYVKSNGSWSKAGNLKGSAGADGADGSSVLTGKGKPSDSLGKEGDVYIDTDSWNLYVKGVSSWDLNGQIKDTTSHVVDFYIDNTKIASTSVKHGEKAVVPTNAARDGYDIKSWNCKEEGGYRWIFGAYPVTSDLELYADYDYSKYTVTFTDSQFGFETQTKTIAYKSSYDFSSVFEKCGYVCTFLTDEEEVFPTSGTYELTKSIKLHASWSVDEETLLSLSSEDINKGSAEITSQEATTTGFSYTVSATPKSGYTFAGWYNGDKWVSEANPYSLALDSSYSLTAHFISEDSLGATPEIVDSTEGTVTYGLYPQTYVKDDETIKDLGTIQNPNGNLWYRYKGEYYVKVTSSPHHYVDTSSSEGGISISTKDSVGYAFSDGTEIKNQTDYWFKCEKIRWRVLSSSEGIYSLLSENVLCTSAYDESSNNYEESDVRGWLNDGFLNAAFSSGFSALRETEVDNSASTTIDSDNNPYASDSKTTDLVYLPSWKEIVGLSDESDRSAVASDYARALGVDCGIDPDSYSYAGYYWTRSPDSCANNCATVIDYAGSGMTWCSVSGVYGVRPAITVAISK